MRAPDAKDVKDSTLAAFSLSGRVAVVTGAAGLLGRQHCRALADAGATVIATDRDEVGCESVAHALREEGVGVDAIHAITSDITDVASLGRLREQVLRIGDRIDVLVNNAAINDRFESTEAAARFSRFENYPLASFREALDVNVTGTFLACQVLGAEMVRRQGGSIINVASTYGMVAPDQRIYQRATERRRSGRAPSTPPAKAPCWRSRVSWRPTGPTAACASTACRRAASPSPARRNRSWPTTSSARRSAAWPNRRRCAARWSSWPATPRAT